MNVYATLAYDYLTFSGDSFHLSSHVSMRNISFRKFYFIFFSAYKQAIRVVYLRW